VSAAMDSRLRGNGRRGGEAEGRRSISGQHLFPERNP
jgi:hypothetical protein